ncbi:hypothetical protein HU200_014297 [Digitaria exilis]|uniref:ABC transporter domain-containing protein n=1 Tax=Digitaria exilis TaxID=1010633 RepID=A0A835FBP3_9POAL|nr:hypothetical protein HU200_014297 [Digitaria exilis]
MDDAGEIHALGSLRREGSAWSSASNNLFSLSSRGDGGAEDDEEALRWAALEKLPTYDRARTAGIANALHITPSRKKKISILHNVSGIIKPHRMTLLLGPPGAGKTSLLLALAGTLPSSLEVTGSITYNGHTMDEFEARRSAAYVSQHDLHMGELTVRETVNFSARCQGIGHRYDLLVELSRREKEASIVPDPETDIYMKVLGLDICADTIVGNNMLRGISGGQKKRVTTAEMLVTPGRALFMDEISTGLDSSTTFQIVNSIRQTIHIVGGTAVIALLQPAPETYELFDDIILLSDGQVVYNGPRENVLEFFESVGFKCPQRKGVADFLQEVTSRKDQRQYWKHGDETYRYVPVKEFAEAFQSFHIGEAIRNELAVPFDKSTSHPAALKTSKYGASMKELLKANIDREILLLKRNSFVYIFKAVQLTLMAIIAMTVFLRTNMHRDSMENGRIYMGALFFGILMIMFNGLAEVGLTIAKLPVFFKQRDLLFYPAWTYSVPSWIIKTPLSLLNVTIWVFITYYVIGFDPNVERLFRQFLLLLLMNEASSGLFRFIAGLARHQVVASTLGSFGILIFMLLGGFLLARGAVDESNDEAGSNNATLNSIPVNKGMVLPFVPLSISFEDIRYSVDMPEEIRAQGVTETRLELLKGISGSFRPGVLTALMGVSGAGKTTLMDVLAGRKTSGYIEGNITISGYPKKQETFARVSGYCEQNDIHSPNITVYESLVFSAWLRLPADVDSSTRKMFIDEVMELVELIPLKDALVGLPGVSGLSTEQRKRLTIAVELVANPSIIFMDEPTSGLDARAAAIVMRAIRNTVDTGRTVAIEGVSKIKDGYNPSTWMLEVTSTMQEQITAKHVILEKSSIYCCQILLYNIDRTVVWNNVLGCRKKRDNQQDYSMPWVSMYASVIFMGVQNSSSVQPVVSVERTVFYRERASHMYSPCHMPWDRLQLNFRYILVQALIYGVLVILIPRTKFQYGGGGLLDLPHAWTLNGLVTSQFWRCNWNFRNGGGRISEFVEGYFGYHHDLLWLVALVVVAFPALFALLLGYPEDIQLPEEVTSEDKLDLFQD